MWKYIFGANKAMLDYSLGEQTLDIANWERENIITVQNLDDMYQMEPQVKTRLDDDDDDVCDDVNTHEKLETDKTVVNSDRSRNELLPQKDQKNRNRSKIILDTSSTFLIYPTKPLDPWCHRS